MPLRRLLGRLAGKRPGEGALLPEASSKAGRAVELNAAISELWQAEATHDKAQFESDIVPIFTRLLVELKRTLPDQEAEDQVLALLHRTTAACHYRWSVRLPLKRPGSDYRKYEIIYTYALVSAMAVDSLKLNSNDQDPLDDFTRRVIPREGLSRLQADPTVWEDWQGYFEQAEIGGLYAVSIGDKQWTQMFSTEVAPSTETDFEEPVMARGDAAPDATGFRAEISAPPPGSGKAMLAAIKEGLKDGSLSFNQPHDVVQVDRDGRTFLEYPAALEWSMDRLALDVDLKRAKNRFDRLKFYKRNADGRQLFRGKLRQRDTRVRGYVFEDASVLWQAPPPTGRFVIENLTTLE